MWDLLLMVFEEVKTDRSGSGELREEVRIWT